MPIWVTVWHWRVIEVDHMCQLFNWDEFKLYHVLISEKSDNKYYFIESVKCVNLRYICETDQVFNQTHCVRYLFLSSMYLSWLVLKTKETLFGI